MTKELKPRAVRISIADAVVTFKGTRVGLMNISRTGALLRVQSAAEIGATGHLVISHNHTTIHMEGKVVRCNLAGTGPQDGEWLAGISFIAPPPPEITALLRRIISLG